MEEGYYVEGFVLGGFVVSLIAEGLDLRTVLTSLNILKV